ncbi:hypothetical protein BVC71_00440 [Marivivens niveibacter]|uniref:HTH lacI-type domain-containing protein n=1 Tax=Marivivens niveibacter TaxID=1930667 RepID=A0A251X068_9RHOB|nr:LacI family DNA-binding transcriptional regulator [Marivivens niveibacter]OUD10022.1 hypothetical protein BVC71_00440 [Marivivens niveibacter]
MSESKGGPLHKRATATDVAEKAGVSQSTVSRCFSPDSKISKKTRDHVLKVAAEIGYTPNAIARSLITRRSGMVGVILTQQSISSLPEMINALSQALEGERQRMLLISPKDETHVGDVIEGAYGYPLDGVISCVTLTQTQLDGFRTRGIPVAFYNRHPAGAAFDSVATDHYEAAQQVADRLHAAGHRRFLSIAGPLDAPVSKQRTRGFSERIEELGSGSIELVSADYSYDGGKAAFLAAIKEKGPFDAVFCANDRIAMAVVDASRGELGLKVPNDLSVVGFDDVSEARQPAYDLTTVRQHLPDMAQAVVELLRKRMAAPDNPPQRILIPGSFVKRGTARLG